MRRILVQLLAVLAAVLLSCGAAPSDALASGTRDIQSNNVVDRRIESAFKRSMGMACAQRGLHECSVVEIAREQLAGDVGYYRVLVKMGDGPFDVVRLNRIVREHRGVPVKTKGSFFFIHGSSEHFRLAMLTLHDGAGLGLFLAQNDIDVWGIDLRYVQIPPDATDVSSAATWGYDLNIKDILIATRAARLMRALTGQGFGKVVLSGHSSGAALLFSVADAEAMLPAGRRDVGGLAPIDTVVKLPDSAVDQAGLSCYLEGLFRSFVYSDMPIFDNLASIDQAKLALTDPNGISPYNPPLTNFQNQLENIGALGFYPLYPFHALAVSRDADGNATGMVYSSINDGINTFLDQTLWGWPNLMAADFFATSCPTSDSAFDNNFSAITVPVLYIGAAGGFGNLGPYVTQVLGSTDVTHIMVQLQPDGNAINDIGHMEPFTAFKAPDLVWHPLLTWLLAH